MLIVPFEHLVDSNRLMDASVAESDREKHEKLDTQPAT